MAEQTPTAATTPATSEGNVTPTVNTEPAADAKFSQSDVDRIVQERLSRDRQKFSDYEDLKKKASDFEKQQEQMSQLELEKKQEYETLKKSWEDKENQYKTQLEQTRTQVQNERVANSLNGAVMNNNAYPDAVDLLKPLTKYNEDGSITIKGKDANGIETDLSIEQGVEQFLKERPYLVKGSGVGGAGTSAGNVEGGQVNNVDLSKQLQNAMAVGDRKLITELKTQIKMKHAGMGVTNIL